MVWAKLLCIVRVFGVRLFGAGVFVFGGFGWVVGWCVIDVVWWCFGVV